MSLLEEFFQEELNPSLAMKILNAASQGPDSSEFFGNRFNVIVDRVSQMVRIEDDLDASDSGTFEVSVSDVIERLSKVARSASSPQ